jgi:hypothetical protein
MIFEAAFFPGTGSEKSVSCLHLGVVAKNHILARAIQSGAIDAQKVIGVSRIVCCYCKNRFRLIPKNG